MTYLFLPFLLLSCAKTNVLIIATTTSIYETSLIEHLSDDFKKEYGIAVNFIPVGSGAAMELAKRGSVDGIITHCPQKELEFIKSGFGISRTEFLYSYFILVGPRNADFGSHLDIRSAFKEIYNKGHKFVSRGDLSGTHLKELEIWDSIKLNPQNKPWYIEAGQSMSSTLMLANRKKAFCLTDEPTYVLLSDKLKNLEPVYKSREEFLLNPYSLIITSPRLRKNLNYNIYMFAEYLKNNRAKDLIANYRIKNVTLFK